MLCGKAVYNGLNLELNTPFDFQLRTQLLHLSFFNSIASSVGW